MAINPAHLRKLTAWQRAAVNIGCDPDHRCPSCREKGGMLYYTRDADPTIREYADGKHVEVGYFCGRCQWANAGSMPIADFKPEAEVMLPDEWEA